MTRDRIRHKNLPPWVCVWLCISVHRVAPRRLIRRPAALSAAQSHSRRASFVMGSSRSGSSSSSSSSSSSIESDGSTDGFSKLKKTKKPKDKKKKKDKSKTEGTHLPPAVGTPSHGHAFHNPPPPYHLDQHASHMHIGEHDGAFAFPHPQPHAHTPEIPIPHGGPAPATSGSGTAGNTIPPQGRRFQTRTEVPFPPVSEVGPAPFVDYGGVPVWVGSAIFEDSVHPCKLVPTLEPYCRVPYGGGEYEHHGR